MKIVGLLVGLVLVVVEFTNVTPVFAAIEPNEPYKATVAQQDFDEYKAAIQNCETPSLECLVRYTLRYSIIEWVSEINGPGFTLNFDGSPTGQADQDPTAIASVMSLTTVFYEHPPAQTSTYVADIIDNAGFAPPAHAQGLGFSSLTPILDLWKVFRNIAYFFFIGVFIVMGFLIMFRYKIGGNTAITAQQAIPSVIVSLVLVTFSYAIAGLLIDAMYLIMIVILGIFGKLLTSGISPALGVNLESAGDLLSWNIFKLAAGLFGSVWSNYSDGTVRDVVSAAVSSLVDSQALNSFAGWSGGLIVSLVVSIAVLISVFKLFFELLKSYFSIVLAVVMAPVILMFGAVPGNNTFMPWLKGIFGNLMAFPTVLLALVMFAKFAGDSNAGSGGFMPPFLLNTGQIGIIGPLLGFATILALPEIVKKVKEKLGASDGGFAAVLAGVAKERAQQAAPLALKTAAIPAGAAVGGAAGAVGGFAWSDAGGNLGQRLIGAGIGMGKGASEVSSRASRVAGGVGSGLGGKSPAGLSRVESMMDKASGFFTKSEINRRQTEAAKKKKEKQELQSFMPGNK